MGELLVDFRSTYHHHHQIIVQKCSQKYCGNRQDGFESYRPELVNPSNAEATFIQSTRTQIFSKTIETLPCWHSLESSRRVLSYEYPFARVSVIFQVFFYHFVLAKLATSSIRVKNGDSRVTLDSPVVPQPSSSSLKDPRCMLTMSTWRRCQSDIVTT